jgi:restriction endonuclease S subunit
MRKEWKTVPLEALAVPQKGAIKIGPFGSPLKKRDLVSSGIHVVGIENVLSGTFDGLGHRFISLEKFQKLRTVEILSGDLLLTMMGTIGKVAVVPDGIKTSIMDSHLLRVRPDQRLCRTDYLAWAIYGSPAVQQAIEAQAHGSIMQGLNSAIVRSLPILLPPLPEQERIVGILDEAFEGIATAKANAEKNLQNARALFESHLQSVFTQRGPNWARSTIGDQLILQRGFDITKDQQSEGDVPVVSSGGIKSFHNRSMAQGPGVVIGRKGTLGKVFYLKDDFWPHDTTLWVKDFKGNNPKCVYYFFLGLDVKRLDSGTANPALNRNQVHPIEISWPLVTQQDTIVAKFDALSTETQRLEYVYQRKLAALDELKKSLLHQAFTGQL